MKKQERLPIAPIVLIQMIEVEWSKAERGGTGATLRNSVPETLAIPQAAMVAVRVPTFIEHFVCYGRRNRFQAPLIDKMITQPATEPFVNAHRGLAISLDDGGNAHVALTRYPGVPSRRQPFKGFTLALGEWGSIRVNGRWTDIDFGWWVYTKLAMNIGLFVMPPRNIFTLTDPVDSYISLADLH